tara:strand:+ start:332 stop:1216 length:885 start_codon:yes stop_codon:yes gene_type:complete
MKTEVKQLRLTVTNIKSVLLSSSKKISKIKKDNDKLREDAIKLQAISMKETSLESTPPSKKAPNKKKKINAKESIFGKAKSLFGIIIGGIFVNALEGLVETLKNFYEDNAPIFNKIADIFVGFGKGLISVWDNSKGLRKKIKEGVEKIDAEDIKSKFTQLKNISDDIQKKLSPIINKDGKLRNTDIDSNIKDKESVWEELEKSFDTVDKDDPLIGTTDDEERINTYYVDQNGHVRRKDDNSRPLFSRFINKEGLERKDYMKLTPVNKNNDLQSLNNGGNDGDTTVIIATQKVEV